MFPTIIVNPALPGQCASSPTPATLAWTTTVPRHEAFIKARVYVAD